MLWDRNAPHDARSELFGGTATVRVWNMVTQPLVLPFRFALACELEPSGRVGRHVQQEDSEIVVGIEGSGTAHVDGVAHPLEAGSVVPLALGQTLAIDNHSSDHCLRYLIIKAR